MCSRYIYCFVCTSSEYFFKPSSIQFGSSGTLATAGLSLLLTTMATQCAGMFILSTILFAITYISIALSTAHTEWSFCPSLPASYVLLVCFALTTIVHLVQAIYHKKLYCGVIVISGVAQTLTYIFRVLSIFNPASFAYYAAWFILILVAPLFTNAFVYMVMGRMVWNYTAKAKIMGVTAWRFGLYFIVLDIV